MVHIIGERHLEMLIKGLEMFPITRILRSENRAQKFNMKTHHNLVYEGPFSEYAIDELIVTCPEHTTIPAISQLKPRLSKKSTILLFHDLPGLVHRVAGLWRRDSPKILVGQFTDSFTGVGQKSGILSISSPKSDPTNPLAKKIIDASTGWVAEWHPYREMTLAQLENLVVQSTIEPLAVVLHCEPGRLADPKYSHIIYPLVTETCRIIQAYYNEPLIEPMRMQRLVRDQATRYPVKFGLGNAISTRNAAPMNFLNGQLCLMAKETDIAHPLNTMFRNMIQAKTQVDPDMMLVTSR